MASQSARGQVIIEALWLCTILFTLLLFISYFSAKVEEEQKKQQFHYWERFREYKNN